MRMPRALIRRKCRDTSTEIETTTSILPIPRISLNSPLQSLNFDLLWYIVGMNANMFTDDRAWIEHWKPLWQLLTCAVDGAHSCSVCRPSGHTVIDLDNLHRRTAEFRREMIRRSETVFLWVKARRCVDLDSPARCMKYLLNTLDENWGRIQRLDANIVMEHIGPDQWAPLCLPAPHLESLNLTFDHQGCLPVRSRRIQIKNIQETIAEGTRYEYTSRNAPLLFD